jgi:hypothetical protein
MLIENTDFVKIGQPKLSEIQKDVAGRRLTGGVGGVKSPPDL